MSILELENTLKEKPGYLKKGPQYLASKFGVSKAEARRAVKKIKSLRKQSAPTKNYAKEFVAKTLIEKGKYNEAIDILNGITKEATKPIYSPSQFKAGSYVVIGCVHLPFHNKDMWNALCEYIKDNKQIKGIVLAGDILDMHSISRHGKGLIDLPGYTLEREYKESVEALKQLEAAIGSRPFVREYFYGNHEDWWNQHGKQVDNLKLGAAGAQSPYNAVFEQFGYKTQFNWKTAEVKIGDLSIMHGEWCNKHTAHKHLTELKTNVMFFHTHRFQIYSESNLSAYNMGGGYDKDQPVFGYMSRAQKLGWKNGFATVTLTDSGKTHVTGHEWHGEFCINGKVYNGNT